MTRIKLILFLVVAALAPATALAASGAAPTLPGRWTRLPTAPISPDWGSAASVWTGKQLLVFGRDQRTAKAANGSLYSIGSVNVAASYDPATRRWRKLSPPAGPANSPSVAAAWTGKEMLVWGSFDYRAYNPATNSWRRLPPAPDDPRRRRLDGPRADRLGRRLLRRRVQRRLGVRPRHQPLAAAAPFAARGQPAPAHGLDRPRGDRRRRLDRPRRQARPGPVRPRGGLRPGQEPWRRLAAPPATVAPGPPPTTAGSCSSQAARPARAPSPRRPTPSTRPRTAGAGSPRCRPAAPVSVGTWTGSGCSSSAASPAARTPPRPAASPTTRARTAGATCRGRRSRPSSSRPPPGRGTRSSCSAPPRPRPGGTGRRPAPRSSPAT